MALGFVWVAGPFNLSPSGESLLSQKNTAPDQGGLYFIFYKSFSLLKKNKFTNLPSLSHLRHNFLFWGKFSPIFY
jgi:hypothetical protein